MYNLLDDFIGPSKSSDGVSEALQAINLPPILLYDPHSGSRISESHRVLAPVSIQSLSPSEVVIPPNTDSIDEEIDVTSSPDFGCDHELDRVSVREDALEVGDPMIVYTERLVDSSTEASVYAGAAGNLPADGKSFLEKIDSCLRPIREEGWFWEGRGKSRKTKHVICHHPNMLSHSYLQTPSEGVLHILPGWTHEMFINDIAYRFSSRYTHRGCAIPFLGGMLCTMRFFNCAGVLSCQRCSPEFRMKGHTVVDPRDADILDAVDARSPLEEVKKKVVGIYLGLEARKKSVGGFCTSRKIQPDGSVKSYDGGPKVITSFTKPGAYFFGCTGYSKSESEKAGGSKGNRHYASSLNLPGPMVEYLQKLISGEETRSADDSSACHYIRGKHKGRSTCPKHGCKLVEIPCRHYPNDKVSAHTMVTIEPDGYHEKTPVRRHQ